MAEKTPPELLGGGKPVPGKKATGLAGIKAWAKAKPGQATAVGLGGAVGLYALYKRKASASSSTSSTSSAGAIDPATGVPYSEELAAAQQSSTGSLSGYGDPYGTASGGYSSGGGGGAGGGDIAGQFSTLENDLATQDQNVITAIQGINTSASGGSSTGGQPGGPIITGSALPAAAQVQPASSTSAATYQSNVPEPADMLTPAQATAAASSGALTPEAALQSEVPAAAETAAERHTQEVANKALRNSR